MKFTPLALGASLLLASPPSAAQATQGLTLLGPLGGSTTSVVIDPLDSDRMIVASYTEGLFLSTDGGVSFDHMSISLPDTIDELTQDPVAGQTLYVIEDKSIYKSLDFGATWNPLGLTSTDSLKNFSVASSAGRMLAVDAFQIYQSTDFGANWAIVESLVPFAGTFFQEALYAPSDSTRAYYGSNNGIMRSNDGGATWFSPGSYSGSVKAMEVHPTDPNTLFVATSSSISRSVDGGATFVDVTTGASVGFGWFLTWEGTRLWYGQLQGLAYSDDLGATWADATSGLFMTPMPIGLSMAFDSNGTRFFGCQGNALGSPTGGGLYKMAAGQNSWQHIGFPADVVRAAAVASNSGRIIVGLGSGVWSARPDEGFLATAWDADTRAVVIDPDNPNRWVVGGVGADGWALVATMTGNGTTATLRYENSNGGSVQDIEYDPQDSDRVLACMNACCSHPAILLSTDSGNNWLEISGTEGWLTRDVSFDPDTPGRVLQISDDGQWAESLDSGLTWGPLQATWPTSGSSMFLTFDPLVSGRIFRGDTGTGLWRSDDDGQTWTDLGVALHAASSIEFEPSTPGWLWVGDAAGNIQFSPNGGTSFGTLASIPGGTPITTITFNPTTDGLILGTDGASAWELDSGVPAPVIYCTAKTSSAGCNASIATSSPSQQPVSGASDYFITASGVQNYKVGLVLAGLAGPLAAPFSGGVLCVSPPLKRGPLVNSQGNFPPTNDCSGSFSTMINNGSIIPFGVDAGPGVAAWYQYWHRDPAGGAGNLGTALSNAVNVTFL